MKHRTKRKHPPSFALRLRTLRVEAGMSQTDLGVKSGLTQQWINHIECGRRLPALGNLCSIIKALGCDANELLGTGRRLPGTYKL